MQALLLVFQYSSFGLSLCGGNLSVHFQHDGQLSVHLFLTMLWVFSSLSCLFFPPLFFFYRSSMRLSSPLPFLSPSFSFSLYPSVELSSLSLCMTNSKQGEPCFYVIGRTENTRLVAVPISFACFLFFQVPLVSHRCFWLSFHFLPAYCLSDCQR